MNKFTIKSAIRLLQRANKARLLCFDFLENVLYNGADHMYGVVYVLFAMQDTTGRVLFKHNGGVRTYRLS